MSPQANSVLEFWETLSEASRSNRPKVFLADDHGEVLDRVLSLLQPRFEVVGAADNGRDAVKEILRLRPQVAVLDITMPQLTGIDAAHEVRRAGSATKFVFLTVHDDAVFVHACLAEGGLGYVIKSRLAVDLVPAINEALIGHRFVSPSVAR
jgi:DNA-binding NarL/FixJ family response regulator